MSLKHEEFENQRYRFEFWSNQSSNRKDTISGCPFLKSPKNVSPLFLILREEFKSVILRRRVGNSRCIKTSSTLASSCQTGLQFWHDDYLSLYIETRSPLPSKTYRLTLWFKTKHVELNKYEFESFGFSKKKHFRAIAVHQKSTAQK